MRHLNEIIALSRLNSIKLTMALLLALFASGCATVSFDQPKPYSQAISDFEGTLLDNYASFKVKKHDGLSGFYPLGKGLDALGMRLRLAETAEKSLDLQYFLMKNDTAGAVMANALLKAADRGVRVRFLLDDIFTTVPDHSFLLINQHPNIEIRIFNPIARSGLYTLNLIDGSQPLYSASARVLADSPDKLINQVNETHMRLITDLADITRQAEKEAVFISPYYIPKENGVRFVRELVDKGVRVVVLTNSLASTNHVPVHAAYARYRKDVIDAGAELYEIRANAAQSLLYDKDGPEHLTLHTKAVLIDSKKIFVGSLNLDPRSIELNAEISYSY